MLAIAPVSVLLMGLLGVLVLGSAVLRIVLVERRLAAAAHRVTVAPIAPAAGPTTLVA